MAQVEAAVPQIGITRGRDVGGEPLPHSACPPTEFPRRAFDRAHVAVYFFERVRRVVGMTQREAGRGRCPQPLSGEPSCPVALAPLDELGDRRAGVHLGDEQCRVGVHPNEPRHGRPPPRGEPGAGQHLMNRGQSEHFGRIGEQLHDVAIRARRDRQGAPRARVVLQESDGTGAPQSDAGERGGERVVTRARERRQRRVLKRGRFVHDRRSARRSVGQAVTRSI